MKETYRQLKDRQQKEFNAFPIGCAFNKDQFAEMKKKLGVAGSGELLDIGGGCYIRKTDLKEYRDLLRRQYEELKEAMTHEDFAISAFKYEAANHEFHINLDPHFDMAMCFGYPTKDDGGYSLINWEKVDNGEFLAKCYDTAITEFLKTAKY